MSGYALPMSGHPRVNILGVGVSAINLTSAVRQIESWITGDAREYVVVCPVYTLMQGWEHEGFRAILNGAGMVTPDGMPLVFLGRMLGHRDMGRVYGPDLMLAFSEAAAERGFTSYYYGGAKGVPEALEQALTSRYPGLKVVGTHSPPFRELSPDEETAMLEAINTADPDVLWVGLGSPRQDQWIARCRDRLRARVIIGVGAAFDFHTGRVPQAPRWMQGLALEWLFRLMTEPRRLWRRYLIYNPLFMFQVALQMLGIRRYDDLQKEYPLQ